MPGIERRSSQLQALIPQAYLHVAQWLRFSERDAGNVMMMSFKGDEQSRSHQEVIRFTVRDLSDSNVGWVAVNEQ